jgi:hypothetical protein
MSNDAGLEDAANRLEMVDGERFSEAADFLRRIELERADAARRALEEAAQRVEAQEGGETYRKAFKASASLLRHIKAML